MSDVIDSEKEESIDLSQYKKQFIQYGILCGVFVVLFGILLTFTLLSRNSWQRGLKNQLVSVFSQTENKYEVMDYIKIENPFSVSVASFGIKEQNSSYDGTIRAFVVRVTTVYGPIPAVFIYNTKNKEAEFVKFLTINDDTVEEHLVIASKNTLIPYWEKRIVQIVNNSNKKNEAL